MSFFEVSQKTLCLIWRFKKNIAFISRGKGFGLGFEKREETRTPVWVWVWEREREMSKKNNLAKRKRQHEYELQSKSPISYLSLFTSFPSFLLSVCEREFIHPVLCFIFFFCETRRERGKGEEGTEAASQEVQDESTSLSSFLPFFLFLGFPLISV